MRTGAKDPYGVAPQNDVLEDGQAQRRAIRLKDVKPAGEEACAEYEWLSSTVVFEWEGSGLEKVDGPPK